MTTPSKAAMDAAKKFMSRHICSDAPYMTGQLATAFDAFAAAQSAALLEALRKYGEHLLTCEGDGWKHDCTCGFTAAIAAAKERK
jgi:proteasome assembly chaperone (PAC2) family protein